MTTKMCVLEAMAHQEGFFVDGDRPQRNNNPLDLTWSGEAKSLGATKGDRVAPGGFDGFSGMAVFASPLAGWRAAQGWLGVPARFDENRQLVRGYRGASIRKVVYRFAPPNENNTEAYIAFVCDATGYDADTILTTEMLSLPDDVQAAVAAAKQHPAVQ